VPLALHISLKEQRIFANGQTDLSKFRIAGQFGAQTWQDRRIGQCLWTIGETSRQDLSLEPDADQHARVDQQTFFT
jgi:hypothetical protein